MVDWDVIDALSMVPGIVMTHVLAWRSDDFVYRVSALSWGWCCVCSMVYHLSHCNQEYLKYDMRGQWISQVFMILVTPQSSWPVIVGGLISDDYRVRVVLNATGAFYFVWHLYIARFVLLASYIVYVTQYALGLRVKWLHSVFHILLHIAGGLVGLYPVKKYTLNVHPDWAWPVFWIGALFLIPVRKLVKDRQFFLTQGVCKTL
jgi:hypothetical protein